MVFAYLYAANQMSAHDFEIFVAVEQVHVVQLHQNAVQFARARVQFSAVRLEAVDVVLRWEVALRRYVHQHQYMGVDHGGWGS